MVDNEREPENESPARAEFGPVTFGKYLLDEEIAKGGMARVYLARLRGLGGFEKRLVVKQILPHLAEDPRFVAMFVDEAKTLVALSHPHVVPVYELGVEGGIYFLAMEHVEGATLADMLAEGTLTPAQAAHVGVQVADALAYAEERFGLVHRDVTPRNVMVEGSGHARLLDFGIAARADAGDTNGSANENRGLYGTPGYLSPEQARGERLGATSDLFALACVLYEATHARPLFSTREIDEVRTLTAARVEALLPDEGEFGAILRKCLQPSPADRPESARTLARLLRAVSATEDDPARKLGERAEVARKRVGKAKKSDRRRLSEGTPTSGPDAPSATLATSELLGSFLEGTSKLPARVESAAPTREPPSEHEGEGTRRLDRGEERPADVGPPRIVVTPTERPKRDSDAPKTTRIVPSRESEPVVAVATVATPKKASLGGSAAIAAAVLGGLAAWLAGRAAIDPRVPDASEVETDTDATMSIPPEDAGPDDAIDAALAALTDAGVVDAGDLDAGDLDAGVVDAGDFDAGDGGESRVRASATLRVTSDGSLTVRIDGRALGHAPIAAHTVSAGDHRLTFECDFLGRSAEERVHFDAGATMRVRVTCNTTPPRVVVAGP